MLVTIIAWRIYVAHCIVIMQQILLFPKQSATLQLQQETATYVRVLQTAVFLFIRVHQQVDFMNYFCANFVTRVLVHATSSLLLEVEGNIPAFSTWLYQY
ncbi:uncharacterized protein LOC143555590 isoform X1 [Bidens hawaiensis]|uniref:uncharacterized protein LOC143555590 isoform X1 n=1 Tax=Bidens hawaiensis TaxID=980011 RepID=UPI0040495C52